MRRANAVWITPEKKGGIQTYGGTLFPAIAHATQEEWTWSQAGQSGLNEREMDRLERELERAAPALIHIQHEYGLFGGSKLPGRYRFPAWIARMRAAAPQAKIVITAHTVLAHDYAFPIRGNPIEKLVRGTANRYALPRLRKFWGSDTFGLADGVVVHSELQAQSIQRAAPGARVQVIPHFVYDPPSPAALVARELPPAIHRVGGVERGNLLVVFGFFSQDKGQDVAVRALAHFPPEFRLVLAGGLRRVEDEAYYRSTLRLAKDLGVDQRLILTGFVQPEHLAGLYSVASLVIAPFRETSGSGSLAQGLSHRAPILASDLALNREIAHRVPGSIEFFKTENPEDLAHVALDLLRDLPRVDALRGAAGRYAEQYSLVETASAHAAFYRSLCASDLR